MEIRTLRRLVGQLGVGSFDYAGFNMAHVANTDRAMYPIGDKFCDDERRLRMQSYT